MKRFHVHLHVADLAASTAFYSKLFAAEPARTEADYAKWMLTDPPVNFAISTRGSQPGLDHFGIQTDNADELAALKAQAQAADLALLDEGETTCCYARSDKYWVTDPQGLAWEQFHTLGNIPVFSEAGTQPGTVACCAPMATTAEAASAPASCCAPTVATSAAGAPAASCCAPAAAPAASCCAPAAAPAASCCAPAAAPAAACCAPAATAPATAAASCCAPTGKAGGCC